jgi:hypothetical protein
MVYSILTIAPIFYLTFGYWMCSSKQLLSNDYLSPVETIQSTMTTHHIYTEVVTSEGW